MSCILKKKKTYNGHSYIEDEDELSFLSAVVITFKHKLKSI